MTTSQFLYLMLDPLSRTKIGVKVKRKQLASTLGITKRTLTNWMNELSMHIG